MKSITVVLLLLWCVSIYANQSTNLNQDLDLVGNYHALVIGNAAYTDPNKHWVPLKTSVSDAQEVASTLRELYGFNNVTLLENANRSSLINAFIKLRTQVNANDSVIIYYAGHGHLDHDNFSYWIPVDAVGNDFSTYLHQTTIVSEVGRIANAAKHTLVIADSCFSGDLLRPSRGASRGLKFIPKTGASPSNDKVTDKPLTQHLDLTSFNYYQRLAKNRSVQVITAGGKEYVDDEYRNTGHSPFTYFLLKKLKDNDQKFVTASQLAEDVKPLVGNNTRQIPQNGVLYSAGDEGGEFVFSHAQIAAVNFVGTPNENSSESFLETAIPNADKNASKHEFINTSTSQIAKPVKNITNEDKIAVSINADVPKKAFTGNKQVSQKIMTETTFSNGDDIRREEIDQQASIAGLNLGRELQSTNDFLANDKLVLANKKSKTLYFGLGPLAVTAFERPGFKAGMQIRNSSPEAYWNTLNISLSIWRDSQTTFVNFAEIEETDTAYVGSISTKHYYSGTYFTRLGVQLAHINTTSSQFDSSETLPFFIASIGKDWFSKNYLIGIEFGIQEFVLPFIIDAHIGVRF